MPHLTAANTYLLTNNEGLVQHLSVKPGFSLGEESMALQQSFAIFLIGWKFYCNLGWRTAQNRVFPEDGHAQTKKLVIGFQHPVNSSEEEKKKIHEAEAEEEDAMCERLQWLCKTFFKPMWHLQSSKSGSWKLVRQSL